MTKLKGSFRWLGVQANSRAITVLLAIGATVGGLMYFVADKVLPVYNPSLTANEFGEGYRRGKREAQLERRVLELETTLEWERSLQEIWAEVNNMSEEERREHLKDSLKNGTF